MFLNSRPSHSFEIVQLMVSNCYVQKWKPGVNFVDCLFRIMINHKCSDPASTDATSGVFEAKSNTEDLLELKLEQIFPPE